MIKISYHLSLPLDCCDDDVLAKMEQIRQAALDLPLMKVGSLDRISFPLKPFNFGGKLEFPKCMIGFRCGFEKEPKLAVYLMRFSQTGRCPRYWFYEDEFWTISRAPDDEFLRRHRSAIFLLEKMRELGFTVQVEDEGGFWESHDSASLLDFKHRMDAIKDPRDVIKNCTV